MDLPPWEQEEFERWRLGGVVETTEESRKVAADAERLSAERAQMYDEYKQYREDEASQRAKEAIRHIMATMLVTNLPVVPGIQKIHGTVRAFQYWVNDDLKADMSEAAELFESKLIETLKLKTVEMGGNAILGLTINTNASPSAYVVDGGTDGRELKTVHLAHALSISIYGTAATLSQI
jgi:hypothetical protein